MQRSARIGGGNGFICVMLALVTVLGVSLRAAPDLLSGGLSNPDTYMRLVRLREILDSGNVVHGVARDGSGHGTLLHWSHLIDSLLCVLALPFGLFMSPHAALHAAALIFGPLSIAALGFAIVWAAAPFAERKWLWLGAILPPLSPAIVSYGIAGVVHHHVPIVVVAVACAGWAARLISSRAQSTAGLALGAWAGLGIWLTPETLPLTMMAFGALFLWWIVSPSRDADALSRAIGLTGLSFALVTLLALLVDSPAGGPGSVEIDRLSVLFAGLALAVASTGASLWALHRFLPGWRARLAAACVVGIAFCSIWAVTFWSAIFHPGMAADEARLDAMFGHIAEMMPVTGIFLDLHFLLTGTLALVIAITMAVRRRSLLLSYAAFCLVILLLLGGSHVRFAAYPEAAGAIALPIALTLVGQGTAAWHQIGQSFTRLATIMLFIQVPYLGELPNVTSSARAAQAIELPGCKVSDALALLAPHPGAVVLADVNDTPELLYRTQVRTVGSLYHRNVDAFLRLRAAWRSAPSTTVPPEIDAAEIALVLGCKTPARSAVVEDLKEDTLFDQARTGQPPAWLRQIGENRVSGQVLYEVVRTSNNGDSAIR